MHPMTLYDIAVREHEHATAERLRGHRLVLRLRERDTPPSPKPRPRRRLPRSLAGEARSASSVRPAAA